MKTLIIVLGVAVAATIASCNMNNDQIAQLVKRDYGNLQRYAYIKFVTNRNVGNG